jgi:hypothetical protein
MNEEAGIYRVKIHGEESIMKSRMVFPGDRNTGGTSLINIDSYYALALLRLKTEWSSQPRPAIQTSAMKLINIYNYCLWII